MRRCFLERTAREEEPRRHKSSNPKSALWSPKNNVGRRDSGPRLFENRNVPSGDITARERAERQCLPSSPGAHSRCAVPCRAVRVLGYQPPPHPHLTSSDRQETRRARDIGVFVPQPSCRGHRTVSAGKGSGSHGPEGQVLHAAVTSSGAGSDRCSPRSADSARQNPLLTAGLRKALGRSVQAIEAPRGHHVEHVEDSLSTTMRRPVAHVLGDDVVAELADAVLEVVPRDKCGTNPPPRQAETGRGG